MSRSVETERIVALLGLAIATLLVLSALGASDAEAKKKKHHHKPPPATPSINTVQCPEGTCVGTAGSDHLIGRDDRSDGIFGDEGDDIYDGKGGSDDWEDFSITSNDTYLVPATEFSQLFSNEDALLFILDGGGSFDLIDLSAYRLSDFALSSNGEGLVMEGTGRRKLEIGSFFTTNSIDFFKFSDGTLTADQIKSKV